MNALIKTSTELVGSNCTNGGIKIQTGLDVNSNGVLDSIEVNNSQTKYICNTSNSNSSGSKVFVSNGTFNVPLGVTSVIVEAYGAGGGGGGGNGGFGQAGNYKSYGGGGGASGAYKKIRIDVIPNSTINITIGAGGLGGSGGVFCTGSVTCFAGQNGTSGSPTSFGSYFEVLGGGGGKGGGIWNNGFWEQGFGGIANSNGTAGQNGQMLNNSLINASGGNGGSFPLTGLIGGIGGTTVIQSTSGDSYCVGGGGGAGQTLSNGGGGGFPGANGRPGLMIIYW